MTRPEVAWLAWCSTIAAAVGGGGCALRPIDGCIPVPAAVTAEGGHNWIVWRESNSVRVPRGKVLDLLDSPVEDALVEVFLAEEGGPSRSGGGRLAGCVVNSRGRFSFPGLRDGVYEIRCTAKGRNRTSAIVTVSTHAKGNDELLLRLEPGT